jgi:hypothetical protein
VGRVGVGVVGVGSKGVVPVVSIESDDELGADMEKLDQGAW